MSILWGVENGWFPLTKPFAIKKQSADVTAHAASDS